MVIFSQFTEFQKAQKKAAKKCIFENNNNRDSSTSYLQSTFKQNVLARNRVKVNPTTEVIGEVTINGKKQPIRILIDTGSSKRQEAYY
jgi:uncharacterized membrane protein YqiK